MSGGQALQRVLVVAVALLCVLGSVAGAAPISVSGSVEAKLEYTTEGEWIGSTRLNLSGQLSGQDLWIGLRWYEASKKMWEPELPSISPFTPYAISLTARGPLWEGGPSFTRTLGDFNLPGPAYMAGQSNAKESQGIMVKDIRVLGANLSGFFAWPKYTVGPLKNEKTTMSWGVAADLPSIFGIDLDVYHNVRSGQFDNALAIKLPDGQTKPIAAIDITDELWHYANTLILYTENATQQPYWTQFWSFVKLRKDGTIVDVIVRPPDEGTVTAPTPESDYDYLLAGHESMADWIEENIAPLGPGAKLTFVDLGTGAPTVPGEAKGSLVESVTAIEGTYQWKGATIKLTQGVQNLDYGEAGSKAYAFRTVSVSGSVGSAGKLMAQPVAMTLTYRDVDADFLPWAALRDADANPVYGWRDRKGLAFNLNTALFPKSPVSVGISVNSYTEKTTDEKQSDQSFTLSWTAAPTKIPFVDTFKPVLTVRRNSAGEESITPRVEAAFSFGGFKNIQMAVQQVYTNQKPGTLDWTTTYTDPSGFVFEMERHYPPEADPLTSFSVTYKRSF